MKQIKLEEIKELTMNTGVFNEWVFAMTAKLKEVDLYDTLLTQSRSLNVDDDDFEPDELVVVQPVPDVDYESIPIQAQQLKRFELQRQDHIRRYKHYLDRKKEWNKLVGILNNNLPQTEVNRVFGCETGGQIWDLLHEFWLRKTVVNFNKALSRLKELKFTAESNDFLDQV